MSSAHQGDVMFTRLGPRQQTPEEVAEQTQRLVDAVTQTLEKQRMANSTYEVREIRFVIEPELTHAYVLCGLPSDGMLGVQGWHHRAFPPSVNVIEILQGDIARAEYLVSNKWAQAAP